MQGGARQRPRRNLAVAASVLTVERANHQDTAAHPLNGTRPASPRLRLQVAPRSDRRRPTTTTLPSAHRRDEPRRRSQVRREQQRRQQRGM